MRNVMKKLTIFLCIMMIYMCISVSVLIFLNYQIFATTIKKIFVYMNPNKMTVCINKMIEDGDIEIAVAFLNQRFKNLKDCRLMVINAKSCRLDYSWFMSKIAIESGFRANASNGRDGMEEAVGYTQCLRKEYPKVSREDLIKPENNLRYGATHYLRDYLQYKAWMVASISYHHGKIHFFPRETAYYLQKIHDYEDKLIGDFVKFYNKYLEDKGNG